MIVLFYLDFLVTGKYNLQVPVYHLESETELVVTRTYRAARIL